VVVAPRSPTGQSSRCDQRGHGVAVEQAVVELVAGGTQAHATFLFAAGRMK